MADLPPYPKHMEVPIWFRRWWEALQRAWGTETAAGGRNGRDGRDGKDGRDGRDGTVDWHYPFAVYTLTTDFTVPESDVPGMVNLLMTTLGANRTITLPPIQDGSWVDLHIMHNVGGATDKTITVQDSDANTVLTWGGALWPVAEAHRWYRIVAYTDGTDLAWAATLEQSWNGTPPPAI